MGPSASTTAIHTLTCFQRSLIQGSGAIESIERSSSNTDRALPCSECGIGCTDGETEALRGKGTCLSSLNQSKLELEPRSPNSQPGAVSRLEASAAQSSFLDVLDVFFVFPVQYDSH